MCISGMGLKLESGSTTGICDERFLAQFLHESMAMTPSLETFFLRHNSDVYYG